MAHLHSEGFQNPSTIDDALRTFLNALNSASPKTETARVSDALGRVLGENVVSRVFIPAANRSVMDGYAVRSADTTTAAQERPVVLKVVGESRTGQRSRVKINSGQAVAVATGGMIPQGADSVVMVEETRSLAEHQIAVNQPISPGQNISEKGEDVSPEIQVLVRGHKLRPQDLGMLRALGFARIRVVKRPRIGIVSTGNELVHAPRKQDVAKVVDLNREILSAMSRELGAEPVDLGIAKDNETAILRTLRKGLRICDVTVITAGSSVGKRDLVPECINKLGKPGMLVHGIAMRPSLPTGLAIVDGKAILSLPGFPVSAMIAFRVFARPLIARFLGTGETVEPIVKASLKERVSGPKGYRAFVRVKLSRTPEGLIAEPLKLQRSSVLMSMVAANGIITIPENVEGLDAGQQVDVVVIGEIAP